MIEQVHRVCFFIQVINVLVCFAKFKKLSKTINILEFVFDKKITINQTLIATQVNLFPSRNSPRYTSPNVPEPIFS
jgi:hypothetical protein